MAIKRPDQLDFSEKCFTVILSGAPGLGKTTLALSAPEPLLLDLDKGVSRVKAEHRGMTAEEDSYEELLDDLGSEEYKAAKTIVIDTGGSLVQLMQPWAKKQEPKAARDGRAMFGVVKREFDRLTAQIRGDRKNVIVVFHTTEQQKGDTIIQRLSCEGSAKDIVWTPADLGGNLFMMGGKRMIGFSPTDEYFAKSCFGIGGVMEIPTLRPGGKNDFMTRLFETARESILTEMEDYQKNRETYESVMEEGRAIVQSVQSVDELNGAVAQIGKMEHGLTSKQELGALLNERARELNAKYDKGMKTYVQIDAQSAGAVA